MIDKPVEAGSAAPSTWAAEMDALLAQLPPAEASALDAIYRERLDTASAAAMLSISVRQVRRRVARGLVLLGRRIATHEPSEEQPARARRG